MGLLTIILSSLSTQAQSDTISTQIVHDAEVLVNDFFQAGECIDVFNFQLSGEIGQAGIFNDGDASIGISSGIVLSTGNINDIPGPNEQDGTTTSYGNIIDDPDLSILDTINSNNSTPSTLSDIVVLEFDFTPTVDQASFEFVFASEEYCYFSLTSFVDIFGFFVSGPGIDGPYQDNGINVALVPGTNTPITAISINNFINPQYFVNNTLANGMDAGCAFGTPVAPNFIEFDGYTLPLQATFDVIPCQTYHIKLAITDTTDDALDSAVFLKANSFSAGRTAAIASNIVGESQDDNEPIEGCGSTDIIFSRGDSNTDSPQVVHYEILPSSTATPGVDFTMLPDSIIIPAGQDSFSLPIEFFEDDLDEGNETLTIRLVNPCSCEQSELFLNIVDPTPLEVSLSGDDRLCEDEILTLTAITSGGYGDISYQWPNGDPDSIYQVIPDSSSTHRLIVTDECFQSDTIDHFVRVQRPSATLGGSGVICDGIRDEFFYHVALVDGDTFSLSIRQGLDTTFYTGVSADTFWIPTTETGLYQLVEASADGCVAEANGVATSFAVDINTTISIVDSVSCHGANDASIHAHPTDGDGQYTYSWAHDSGLTHDSLFNLGAGQYTVHISDHQGCLDTATINIDQPLELLVTIDTIELYANCANNGAAMGLVTGGNAPYTYAWSDGTMLSLNNNLTAGTHTLSVTDANDCLTTATITILADDDLPTVDVSVSDTINCSFASVSVIINNPDNNHTYTWTNSDNQIVTTPSPTVWSTNLADTYTLSITDNNNGCSNTQEVEVHIDSIAPMASIQSNTQHLDCNQNSLELSANGDANWLPTWTHLDPDTIIAQNQWTATLTSAGLYELHIVDPDNFCSFRDSIQITEDFNAPSISTPLPDSLSCTVASVDLSVNVDQGSGNYNYLWNGPAIDTPNNQASISVSAAGNYTITVEDLNNGCTSDQSITVAQAASSMNIAPLADTSLTCVVNEITIDVQGIIMANNVNYLWSNAMGQTISNTSSVSVNTAGLYSLAVTDIDLGCTHHTTWNVTQDTISPVATLSQADTLTCLLDNTNINSNIISGSGDYTYLWTGPAITSPTDQPSISLNDIGLYALRLTDNTNGCFTDLSQTVYESKDIPDITPINDTLLNCYHPSIELIVSSSTSGNLSYSWTDDSGMEISQSATVTIDNPAAYHIQITNEDNACSNQLSVNVNQDTTPPIANLIDNMQLDCTNDTLTIVAQTSDTGWTPTWTNQDGDVLENMLWEVRVHAAGTYQLAVINNENGCTATDDILITENTTPPTAAVVNDAVDIDCFDHAATIDGSPSSGTSTLTYSLLEADGTLIDSANTPNFSVQQTGNYFLMVTDNSNGCSDDVAVVVESEEPVINNIVSTDANCLGEKGSINVTDVSGGQAPYLYSIDGGNTYQSSPVFETLASGTYELWVEDAAGCSTMGTASIFAAAELIIELDEQIKVALGEQITLNASVNRGMDEINSIEWSASPQLSCTDCLTPVFTATTTEILQLTVTDNNGCEATVIIRILVDDDVPVYIPNVFSPHNGDGKNDFFIVYGDVNQILQVNNVQIYDRWGNQVYSQKELTLNSQTNAWDGRKEGQKLNTGVYVYSLELLLSNGEVRAVKGDLLLVD